MMKREKSVFFDERIKDAGNFPKVILLDTTAFCNL
jgi:hypothetical protein